jgi:hypothetical protein
MTDPFGVLSAAGAVIQIIDSAVRLLYQCRQFYESVNGSLDEHRELHTVTEAFLEDARSLLRRVDIRNGSHVDPQLYLLCRDSEKIAKELIETLESLKLGRSPTLPEAVRCALKSVYKRTKILDLEARLDRYRKQIDSAKINCIFDNSLQNNPGRQHHDRLRGFDDLTEDDTGLRVDLRPTLSRNKRQPEGRDDVSIFPRILPEAVEPERGFSTRRNIPDRLPSRNILDSNSVGKLQEKPIQLQYNVSVRFTDCL